MGRMARIQSAARETPERFVGCVIMLPINAIMIGFFVYRKSRGLKQAELQPQNSWVNLRAGLFPLVMFLASLPQRWFP